MHSLKGTSTKKDIKQNFTNKLGWQNMVARNDTVHRYFQLCAIAATVSSSEENKRPWRFEITSSLISGLHTTVTLQPDVHLPLGPDRHQWDYHVLALTEEHTWKLFLIWRKHTTLVTINNGSCSSCRACCQRRNKHFMKQSKKTSAWVSALHVRVCVVCVATPQSPHCGAPVGEQHWETSAWLGWTGPSAGLIASPHTPAAPHTHTRKASE